MAQILQHTDLASFAESYAFIHEELTDARYKDARTHLEGLLVERAAAVARREKFDASEVRTFFKNASPMMRVLILGLMRGDPSLADGATIVSAIAEARSGNEQYHGLQLAHLCWHRPCAELCMRAVSLAGEVLARADRRYLAGSTL